jgi:prophage DNA circulation protein
MDVFASLRAASFRGIGFDVPEDQSVFGRRVQTHEYPGRDEPYHEDLGLSVQGFTLEALIHGADFLARAGAFETALKAKGPGRLVHPVYGDLDVVVRSATRRHSTQAAGEVSFSITFEKHGPPLYPTALRDTAAALDIAAKTGFEIVQSTFNRVFIASAADFLLNDAASRVKEHAAILTGALKDHRILAYLPETVFPKDWDVSSASILSASARGLFEALCGVFASADPSPVGSVPTPDTPTGLPGRAMAALLQASAPAALVSPLGSGGVRAVRVSNAQAIDHLFRLNALCASVRIARHAVYESREEALLVRDRTAQRLSDLRDGLGADGWDEAWRAAGGLLVSLSRDINERIGRLPRTARVRTLAPRPSLALANRLYGDDPSRVFERAADIVSRNRVRHPGLVPASDHEVLIDAA